MAVPRMTAFSGEAERKKSGGGAGREAALTAKPDGFVIRKHNWDGTQAKDKVC